MGQKKKLFYGFFRTPNQALGFFRTEAKKTLKILFCLRLFGLENRLSLGNRGFFKVLVPKIPHLWEFPKSFKLKGIVFKKLSPKNLLKIMKKKTRSPPWKNFWAILFSVLK